VLSSQKRGKIIHSEAREMINHNNHHCRQAEEQSLILPLPCADERTALCCGALVTAVKYIFTGQQTEKLCRVKALYF
jgi:hypothetical protein